MEWIASPGGGNPPDTALVRSALGAGATKIALGTSLDAGSRSVFLKVLAGDGKSLVRSEREEPVPVIEPFIRIPEEELLLYARLNGFEPAGDNPGEPAEPFEREVLNLLEEFTARHPSAMFSLSNLGDALAAAGGSIRRRSAGEVMPRD